jgi:hypothetical protein
VWQISWSLKPSLTVFPSFAKWDKIRHTRFVCSFLFGGLQPQLPSVVIDLSFEQLLYVRIRNGLEQKLIELVIVSSGFGNELWTQNNFLNLVRFEVDLAKLNKQF